MFLVTCSKVIVFDNIFIVANVVDRILIQYQRYQHFNSNGSDGNVVNSSGSYIAYTKLVFQK